MMSYNMTENWKFSVKQKEDAISYYHKNGVVGFHDLLNSDDLNSILNGITEAVNNGNIKYNSDKFEGYQNDIIFCHPILEKYVKNEQICNITRETILNSIGPSDLIVIVMTAILGRILIFWI